MGRRTGVGSIAELQRAVGNRQIQRMLRAAGELDGAGSSHLGSEVRPAPGPRGGAIRAKLTTSEPGDELELEADRVAEQVMRMKSPVYERPAPPAIQRDLASERGIEATSLQRSCTACGAEAGHVQAAGARVAEGVLLRDAESKVDAVGGGQPLSPEQRDFFEPRFGVNFGAVRVHTGASADAAARAVGALAYTRRSDIVFRSDQYNPDTASGRQLLAHELTHVVQQGAAPSTERRSADDSGETFHDGVTRESTPGHLLQRVPGDGMLPPGDCPWGTYVPLRGAVESAKAIVSMLGACSAGDTCLFLATKIAAITAEIAARLALDATCFRGGDGGHRQQVQDKINMMNRCYRFFVDSNCPQQLLDAMAAVVARAREVVEAAALAVIVVAAVVALIAAVILLIKAIIAAGAAAAVAASAVAAMAVLMLVLEQIAPESTTPTA